MSFLHVITISSNQGNYKLIENIMTQLREKLKNQDATLKVETIVSEEKESKIIKKVVENTAFRLYCDLIRLLFDNVYPKYKKRSQLDQDKFVATYLQAFLNIDPKKLKEEDGENNIDYWNEITDTVMKTFELEEQPLLENDSADTYGEIMESLMSTYSMLR